MKSRQCQLSLRWENEDVRDVTCPRSHSKQVAEPGLQTHHLKLWVLRPSLLEVGVSWADDSPKLTQREREAQLSCFGLFLPNCWGQTWKVAGLMWNESPFSSCRVLPLGWIVLSFSWFPLCSQWKIFSEPILSHWFTLSVLKLSMVKRVKRG